MGRKNRCLKPPPKAAQKKPRAPAFVLPTAPPQPTSLYREKIQLIWAVRRFHPRLSPNVIRLVCGEYLGVFVSIASLSSGRISLGFDCVNKEWLQSDYLVAPEVRGDCSILLLEASRVFVCGGQTAIRRAFVLESGSVELTMRTKERHVFPGLVYEPRSACAYIFGGSLGYRFYKEEFSSRSEKYFVKGDVWQKVPDMPVPRGKFNPCLHHRVIYLSGGRISTVHAYNLFSSEYVALPPLNLPAYCDLSLSSTCFTSDGQITVLYSNCIAQFGSSNSWTVRRFAATGTSMLSSCTPAVYQHSLYIVRHYSEECRVFDLEKLVFMEAEGRQ